MVLKNYVGRNKDISLSTLWSTTLVLKINTSLPMYERNSPGERIWAEQMGFPLTFKINLISIKILISKYQNFKRLHLWNGPAFSLQQIILTEIIAWMHIEKVLWSIVCSRKNRDKYLPVGELLCYGISKCTKWEFLGDQ